MRKIITISFISLSGCSLFGGGIDPCAQGSPLQGDPAVAADCQSCGQSPCPSETGETGGQSHDVVTCRDTSASSDGICALGDQTSHVIYSQDFHKVQPISECDGVVSPAIPCWRSWWDPNSNNIECTTCDVQHTELDLPPSNAHNWSLCVVDGMAIADPAIFAPMALSVGPAWTNWAVDLICRDDAYVDLGVHEPPAPTTPFICPSGMIGLRTDLGLETGPIEQWTCQCPDGSDTDCPHGWVCEAGWVLDGMRPRPTLCTTDDGGNGIAPDGPIVYGFDSWSDGFAIDVGGPMRSPEVSVVMSASALAGAWLRLGIYNDDQRFEIIEDRDGFTVRIVHCGPGALCAQLGLSPGDEIDVSIGSVVLADGYLEASGPVRYADGRAGWLSVMTE